MMPASLNSAATSDARRTLSPRSSAEKPRSRVRPVRRLSPSMLYTFLALTKSSSFSSALQMVVLPAPDSPVIHSVAPFCPRASYLFLPRRHEVSLASAEHSMMFLSGRASILPRYAETTSASFGASAHVGHVGHVRYEALGQKGATLWMTGLSGA